MHRHDHRDGFRSATHACGTCIAIGLSDLCAVRHGRDAVDRAKAREAVHGDGVIAAVAGGREEE